MKINYLPWRLRRFLSKSFGIDLCFDDQRYKPNFFSENSDEKSRIGASNKARRFLADDHLLNKLSFLGLNIGLTKNLEFSDVLETQCSRVIEKAEVLCDKAFPVYSENLPPLVNGFSWSLLDQFRTDDILYGVRPHRFGFAPLLSLAAVKDNNFLGDLDSAISDWMKFAEDSKSRLPYLSNLVVIYRIIALTWSFFFIATGVRKNASCLRNVLLINILSIIKEDTRFLQTRLGNSHPNNHLLADYFAGWFISFFYPEFVDQNKIFAYESLWLSELKRQYYSDGGNAEHSVHYHEFGCEMAIIYILAKRNIGELVDVEVEGLIGRMLLMQTCLSGKKNRQWNIGDSTEDSLLPLSYIEGNNTDVLSVLYNKLVKNTKTNAATSYETSLWLFGGMGEKYSDLDRKDSDVLNIHTFPEAGFYFVDDLASGAESLFRTGVSPGSNFIPGHMHSDCLSLYLRFHDKELFTASGTYSYRYGKIGGVNLRNYFCSPASHSCFVIKGEDHLNQMVGDFRDSDNGLRVSTQTCSNPRVGFWCEGQVVSNNSYNAYTRGFIYLPGSVALVYDVIPDSISGLEKGFGWQLAPDITVSKVNQNVIELRSNNLSALIVPANNLDSAKVYHGDLAKPLGWVSKGYGLMESAPYCYYPFDDRAGVTGFLLLSDQSVDSVSFNIKMYKNSIVLANCKLGNKEIVILLYITSDSPKKLPGLPEFTGRLLAIEYIDRKLKKLTGLSINSICWPEQKLNIVSKKCNRDLEIEFSNDNYQVRYIS